MTEQKTYAQHNAEVWNFGEERGLEICAPTSTGNETAYWDAEYGVPVWKFPIGPVDPWDEAIADDREMFPHWHIHYERESRDCDGRHGDYGIVRPNDDDYDELGGVDLYKFWSSQIRYLISAHAVSGILKVECDPYDESNRYAEWSEDTDEGYSAENIRLCKDECEPPKNSHYDQYAEMMGY